MKSVAIIGNGWVGKAMQELFPDALVYVRDPDTAFFPNQTNDKEKINQCDIAFICVPTPSAMIVKGDRNEESRIRFVETPNGQGKLDTSIVEECVSWLQTPLIVIRSTVNPGDCERWCEKYGKVILFQPEYLGETPAHPLLDTSKTPFLIIGGLGKNEIKELIDLYATVYNANIKIRQVTLEEAEIIKLSENRAIAFKVAECQELYDACQKAGVDYYTIREAVYGDDPRFNLWWSFIYPDKRGFNSKCLPKDVYAWAAWAESLGYTPKVTRAILEKNKEWIQSK